MSKITAVAVVGNPVTDLARAFAKGLLGLQRGSLAVERDLDGHQLAAPGRN